MFFTAEKIYIIIILQNLQKLIPSRTSGSSKLCNGNYSGPNKLCKSLVLKKIYSKHIGLYRLYIICRIYLVWKAGKEFQDQFRVYSGFSCSELTCHLTTLPTSPTLGRFPVNCPRKKGQGIFKIMKYERT